MKKIYILLTLFTFIKLYSGNQDTIALTVTNNQQAPMPIALMILNAENKYLRNIATIIKKDLAYTDQFQPLIKKYNANITKKEFYNHLQTLAEHNIPLALSLNISDSDSVEWKLYDTTQCSMINGKKTQLKKSLIRAIAHAIADEIYEILTGNPGFFSSYIAYCKESKNEQGRTIRKLFIANFDGSHEKLIVDSSSLTFAPRWHPQKPHIYYSESTSTNMCLMKKSLKTDKQIQYIETISNFDGINMTMAFSIYGSKSAYCASRGNGSCQIYLVQDNQLKRCTKNSGNNTSPVFIDENRLCFCSDFQTGKPQIYIGNVQTRHLQRITHGGYCTSPSYNPITNKIAYHQMIQGNMQIIVYDCTTKTHTQITFDKGNKQEASWSPNGNYLLYSHEKNGKNSLCIYNFITKTTKFIKSDEGSYTYPQWSPNYKYFSVI